LEPPHAASGKTTPATAVTIKAFFIKFKPPVPHGDNRR
jgi:hypothetical protein